MYSIKEISILSGIKPHTIRVWEKRYKMFVPSRTDTNIRRYSEDDLKLALNITMLLTMGYKISRIAKLSSQEISSIVTNGNKHVRPPQVPESIFEVAINLNKQLLNSKLNDTIATKGLEWTFENLIVPFQKRMGLLWQARTISPAQEHFASNIVREILISQSTQIDITRNKKDTILFYLPPDEMHELGLLYFNYIAGVEGYQTIYLGQNVPINDVIDIALMKGVSILFTSFTMPMDLSDVESHFNTILSSIPNVKLLVSGNLVEKISSLIPSNARIVSSAQQFRDALA